MRRILILALATLVCVACGRGDDSAAGAEDFGLRPVTPEETYHRMQQAAARKRWAELCSYIHPEYLVRVEKYCRQLATRPSHLGGDKARVAKCAKLSGIPLIAEVVQYSSTARSLFEYIAKPDGRASADSKAAEGGAEGLVTVHFPDGTRRLYYMVMVDAEWKYLP